MKSIHNSLVSIGATKRFVFHEKLSNDVAPSDQTKSEQNLIVFSIPSNITNCGRPDREFIILLSW